MRTNRRRFLLLAVGSAGSLSAASILGRAQRRLSTVTQTTHALGTEVSITALHRSPQVATQAIADAFAELAAVERLMSIYRPDSQISRLNRDGVLHDPDQKVCVVLNHAQAFSQLSGGAFDVTVQPLWEVFAAAAKARGLPDDTAIAAARAKVDWRQLEVRGDGVRFSNAGMKLTLNGIAQGFAADMVLAALQRGGVEHALINTGELGSLGRSPRGDAWCAGIQHPREADAYVALAKLDGRALATSGDYATKFSADGRLNHILDPRTGFSPTELASVSVVAPLAMDADALSTTLFVLGHQRGLELLRQMPACDALFVTKDGETIATAGFPLCDAGRAV